jgi:hypothetical protein
MKKVYREVIRLAEREGVIDVHLKPGMPHGRLTGLLEGKPISLVIGGNALGNPRGAHFIRQNIRHLKRQQGEHA